MAGFVNRLIGRARGALPVPRPILTPVFGIDPELTARPSPPSVGNTDRPSMIVESDSSPPGSLMGSTDQDRLADASTASQSLPKSPPLLVPEAPEKHARQAAPTENSGERSDSPSTHDTGPGQPRADHEDSAVTGRPFPEVTTLSAKPPEDRRIPEKTTERREPPVGPLLVERTRDKVLSEEAAHHESERRTTIGKPALTPVRAVPASDTARPPTAHPAGQARPSLPRWREIGAEGPSSPPTVKVTIGRIEVRATTPPAPPTPRTRRQRPGPALTLDEYLKKRSGERK
jgi:hypothetical protein